MASSGKSIMTTEWWCRGDLTAILESPHGRQEIALSRPCVLIGASESADVRLTGPGIPRRLLYVHAAETGLFAVPLVEPSQFHPLPQGRLLNRVPLQLGPYRVTLHWRPETGLREDPRESDLCRRGSLPGPGWEVEVRCDDQALALIHIRRQLTLIGRRKPCAVQFAHPTVSACHCVVIAETERLWAVDLGSANGTRLDGEAVTAAGWPEHVPLSIGRLNLIPRRRTGAEDAAAQPSLAGEAAPIAGPELGDDDGRASVLPPIRPETSPESRRSERRLRQTAAHPGFPPPHIALPGDSPQNRALLPGAPEVERATGDPSGRSGWNAEGTSPAAGTENASPAAEEAVPSSIDTGDGRLATDRPDGEAEFVSSEKSGHDFITMATNGAAPWDACTLLVVPPFTDAGQGILEQPAGFAMQDDRSAVLVKDLVLSLLAEEAESEGDARTSPASRIAWSETVVASTEWDACREASGLLSPEDRAECLARREAELAARETFLHDFAKTLEEMSAELLHFQDSLLAEDDRIQQEKKRLEEVRARLGEDREALCREQDAAMTELRRIREAIHFEERKLAETREEVEAALVRQMEERQALAELRAEVERERAALHEERLQWEASRRAAEEERRRLDRDREEWQTRREAEPAAQAQQAAALQAAQAALLEREAQWERRRAELEEAERDILRRETELAARAETLERDLAAVRTRQAEAEAAFQTLAQRERSLHECEQALHAREQAVQARDLALQAETQRLAEQSESLRRREALLNAEQQALHAREAELEEQHAVWRRRIEEWERRAEKERQEGIDQAELQRETERLRAECTRLTHELEARDAEAARHQAQWQAEASRLQAELDRAAEDRENLREDIRRRDAERRQWEQDRQAWEEQRAALLSQTERLQSTLRQWEQEREDWRRGQADAEARRIAWETERKELQSRLAEWELERRKWEQRCAELEDRLSRRQADQSVTVEPTAKGPPPAEDRPNPRTPADIEPRRESAGTPPDFRRFISKQKGSEPLVIPRLPPRRRSAAPRWLTAAVVLAGAAAAVTWYHLPRPAMTTATLDFSQAPKLMHVRDGTVPAGLEAADFPVLEPFLPDEEEVVRELLTGEDVRNNAVVASLAEPQRQLPGLLFISRSEDVPFMHLRLRTTLPAEANSLLQRWCGIYSAALRRKTEAAGRAALERIEAERHDVSMQIARLTDEQEEIATRLGTSRPVELEARHLQAVHMVAVGEQELGQLTRQMADLTQRREAASATAAQESPAVDPAELDAALEADPEALEVRAKLAGLESPPAADPQTAPAASPPEDVAELKERWDALRAKHQQRLAMQRKEAAKLTVETLTGELQALEARRNEVTAEIAEQRQIAADCAAAAETLRRAEQELPELKSRAVRLAAKAEQLQAALADAAGRGPAVSLQTQRLHEPAEFLQPLTAALAAALCVFAAWGVSALLLTRRHPVRYFIEQDAASEPSLPQPGKQGLKRAPT